MGLAQYHENLLDPRQFDITTLCANRDDRIFRGNRFEGFQNILSENAYDNEDTDLKKYDSDFYNELLPPLMIVGTMLFLLNI